ncbi:MAG: peptidoglycan DD-metalloendopeptidase family protein [Lachnospiraceae bacterium]|nr:peptidoglycan DD-metalloendopeptidase family protein [Lachnospiraceae bacterium]
MSIKTKRIVTGLLACVIVLAMMLSIITPVFAEELDILEEQQRELEQKANDAEALKNATQDELTAAQSALQVVKDEMATINAEIQTVSNRIGELNQKITENEGKLKIKEAELAQAKEDMKMYYAALKGRIRMMYESDRSNNYLEVLLNASSISDFFSRLEYISQMVEYDNKIMEELDACRKTIQESKEVIENTKKELETNRADEQKEQERLQQAYGEKQEKLNELENNRVALQMMADEQDASYQSLMAAIADNETKIQNEKDRIEQEAAANQRPSEPNGGGSSEGGSSGSYDPGTAPGEGDASDRVLSNGYYSTWPGIGNQMLGWPCNGYTLSSLYGPRIHPITGEYKNHGGIDFCVGYGEDIYACAGGVVVEANTTDDWGGGWGYYVVIQHYNGLSTLYAHCSSIHVSEGQEVGAGQNIAQVGSTGMSTGPHLHLEVYSGGGRVNPEDYL